jgi:hypothetical protein
MKIHPNPHTQNNAMHEGFPMQGQNTHPSAHLGSKQHFTPGTDSQGGSDAAY